MAALLYAIGNKDMGQVHAMVQHVNVNDNSEGITPLEMAVQFDSIALAQLLLEHGSNINPRDLVDPIRYSKSGDMLQLLLSKGADPYEHFEYYPNKDTNAFVEAVRACSKRDESQEQGIDGKADGKAKAKQREIVRILLDHDNGLGEPEVKGPYGLYAAVALGDTELIKRYFSDGVRVERCYELGLNLLLKACRNKNFELATLLLEHGANPNETDRPSRPYKTPLNIAMDDKNVELVRLLLGRGADDAGMPFFTAVTMHQAKDRLTGLMYAGARGLLEMVKEVLAHGRDVNAVNTEGHSALFYCDDSPKFGPFCPRVDPETNLAIIWELLKAGAHCTSENQWDGYTTLLKNSQVVFENEYYMTNLSGITAPALLLKACGSSSESLQPYIDIMKNYLDAPDQLLEKIFKHDLSFYNFNNLFQLVILCGNKPTRRFVYRYRNVVWRATGKVDGATWLNDIADSGYSLKELCRIKLREIIRHPLAKNAMSDSIPLPSLLKKYILFDDILSFCS